MFFKQFYHFERRFSKLMAIWLKRNQKRFEKEEAREEKKLSSKSFFRLANSYSYFLSYLSWSNSKNN